MEMKIENVGERWNCKDGVFLGLYIPAGMWIQDLVDDIIAVLRVRSRILSISGQGNLGRGWQLDTCTAMSMFSHHP